MTQTAGQSKANNNHDTADNLPAPIPGLVLMLPEQAIKAAEDDRKAGHAFPDAGGSTKLYNSLLVETPFVIVSEARFGRKPAATIPVYDPSTGLQVGTRTIPEQDCVNFTVRLATYDPETSRWDYAEPQLAELTGVYLLNQVRGWGSEKERFSWLYNGAMKTIRRNKRHTTAGGDHPYMLDNYSREADPAFKAETASTY